MLIKVLKRSLGSLHWKWDLGLVHGTLHFTRASPKFHVHYIVMASQGLEVGTLPSSWDLFRRVGPRANQPLGLVHMGSQVVSPNYDMDAYMATLYGGEAWDLCCELGRAKS